MCCSFDVRHVGGALMALGFTPPPTWTSLDTQWLAKASFGLQPWLLHDGNSTKNGQLATRLEVLAPQLGVTKRGADHRYSAHPGEGSIVRKTLLCSGSRDSSSMLWCWVCYT
jgi:hypothetical protein